MKSSKRKCKRAAYGEPRLRRVRPLLGTYVEIELHGHATEATLHAWITAGFEAIAEIDRLMSRYRPDSDLSRLNQAEPGAWVKIDPHTAEVLMASNELYLISEGVFDIRHPSSPADTGRGSKLNGPPTETLGGDGFWHARKSGPWTFDLGGIAKGYAVDRAVEAIQRASRGHRVSGIVNAGGDLRRWGQGTFPVALATSAVRTRETKNRLTPAVHLRMPEGKALARPQAVTVAADRCMWSDALTKIMLMGTPAIAKSCLEKYNAQALTL